MKCPECETTENIKWFLRHQPEEGEEEGATNANVITVLCTDCGHNETVFIRDYLEDIFTSWSELPPQNMDMGGLGALGGLFGGLMGGMGAELPEPEEEPEGWRSATNAADEIRERNKEVFGQLSFDNEIELPQDDDIIEVEPNGVQTD